MYMIRVKFSYSKTAQQKLCHQKEYRGQDPLVSASSNSTYPD